MGRQQIRISQYVKIILIEFLKDSHYQSFWISCPNEKWRVLNVTGQIEFVKVPRKSFSTINRDTEIVMDQEELWPMRMVAWKQESYSENLYNGMIYSTIPWRQNSTHHPHLPLWILNSNSHTCARTHWRWACGLNQFNKSTTAVWRLSRIYRFPLNAADSQ